MLHVSALLLGLFSLFIVQSVITFVWGTFGVTWGPGNLPVAMDQKVAMLMTTFVAGLVGPMVATLVCRKVPVVVLAIMCLIGLTVDVYAAMGPLAPLVVWFRVVFVLSVPMQIVLGGYLGYLLVKQFNSASVAASAAS